MKPFELMFTLMVVAAASTLGECRCAWIDAANNSLCVAGTNTGQRITDILYGTYKVCDAYCCDGADKDKYVANSGRWVGTSPFCGGSCSDCRSDEFCAGTGSYGDGAKCWTGSKVMCIKKRYGSTSVEEIMDKKNEELDLSREMLERLVEEKFDALLNRLMKTNEER